MTFIAGPYTNTYDGASIGIVEEGFFLDVAVEKDLVVGDNLAAAVQDAAYLAGQCFLSATIEEWDDPNARDAYWPYFTIANNPVTQVGIIGQVGRMDVASSLAKVLVLTAVAGTTAAAEPLSMTANRTIWAENFNQNWLFGPRVRRVPFRWRLYPFTSTAAGQGSQNVWFDMAAS